MSVNAILPAAILEANGFIAQLKGMNASADGNFQIAGTPYTGNFGNPQVEEVLHPSGGYRRRTFQILEAPMALFSAEPDSQQQLVRTDVTPHQTFRIESVVPLDSLQYRFSLVRVGV